MNGRVCALGKRASADLRGACPQQSPYPLQAQLAKACSDNIVHESSPPGGASSLSVKQIRDPPTTRSSGGLTTN